MTRSTQRRIAGFICLALLLGAAVFWKLRPTPAPPFIDTQSLDPAVAALINSVVGEVHAEPRSGGAWGKLGSVLMHYGFAEETRRAFAQAEQRAPRDPRWPYLHALVLLPNEAELALSKLERASALAGFTNDAPRLQWARSLAEHGRPEEAAREFRVLLRASPNHAAAWLGLARLEWAAGRICTNELAHCLADPHTAQSAHALLAQVQLALGDPAAADEAARKSRALPADEPWADPYWEEASIYRVGCTTMLQDASAWMDQGHWPEALALLRQVVHDYPQDPEAWYLLGWAYNRQQRPVEAEAALQRHLQVSPESARGLAQWGVALLQQGRAEEAMGVLMRALQLKPTWRELHFNLGYACQQLGRESEAIGHLREALVIDPGHVETYCTLAELMVRRSQFDEARQLVEQALQLSPSDPRAQAMLQRLSSR